MRTLPARVDSRMRVAAGVLTGQLQAHAAKRGVPSELVSKLVVNGDDHRFEPTVSDPEYRQAFDDHEWGSIEHPPTAFVRTFQPELDQAHITVLDHALREHLGTL